MSDKPPSMTEEIWRAARRQIDDRLSSPLLGTFIISWSLWNYKFYVILFSAAQVTQTFKLIETIVFPDTLTLFLRGFLYPLLTTAAYLLLYPYPARWAYRLTQLSEKRLNDVRRDIEGQKLLSIDESRRIRAEREQLEVAHINEIDRKNQEIDRLRAEIAQLNSAPKTTQPSTVSPTSPASPTEQQGAAKAPVDLNSPVDSASLAAYTRWKFPDLQVSELWNDRAVRDLDKRRYPSLRSIDLAVERAKEAVAAYSAENPDWFQYGTDYVTKSLGLVDVDFRSKHAFAQKSLDAFARFEGLLRPPQS
jgi:hypothetical protein